MKPDPRPRVTHGFNADGMVACNPRDKEAALRAEVGEITTGNHAAVTCAKCRTALRGEAEAKRRHDRDVRAVADWHAEQAAKRAAGEKRRP